MLSCRLGVRRRQRCLPEHQFRPIRFVRFLRWNWLSGGYTLTAVDLSAALIEKCRKNLLDEGLESQVRLVVADARNLSEVTEKRFDAVLLMGPLYHLVAEADRNLALREVFDRLRAGGVSFSSFNSRFGIWVI